VNVEPYVESIRKQLMAAADAGGDDAHALAERLAAPLDSAIRLAIQDALAAAADEITLELAPGSVEIRLRGRDPEFVVSLPPTEHSEESNDTLATAVLPGDGGDTALARINLRLPDRLKSRVEEAADREGLSINAWLVRATAAAVERTEAAYRRPGRAVRGSQRYSGWVR
jgi:HicB-like protein involved in pilus formation